MPSPVQVGDFIAGKYRVDGIIGQGGMGVVVAATDTVLDRRVAVKFLLPQYAENQTAAGRFLREARATARLNSEHAVRIIEVGELENGSPFMAMEYLQGVDLGTLVERQGALPIELAVDYALQAARGLAEAHAAGIIHRDVKPSNLFLAYQAAGKPIVKVLDFGVSKLNLGVEAGAGALTTTGQTLGSPLYMAPEQMRSSHHVDARSDIWGLGVVLFELLTGSRPFSAESLAELVLVINQDPPRDPRTLRPDLPPPLCAALLRCLEKDPARRHASVPDLIAELAPFGSPETRGLASTSGLAAAPASRMGTLVVAPGDVDAARLRALGDAVLGGGSVSSIPPGAGTAGSASAGTASAAPWASTKDGTRTDPPGKKRGGLGIVIGATAGFVVVAVTVAAVVLSTGAGETADSDIVSAASELSRAAETEVPGAPETESSASGPVEPSAERPEPSVDAPVPAPASASAPASTAGAPVESAESAPATSSSDGAPPPPRVIRRVRPQEPRSAKDRLGF